MTLRVDANRPGTFKMNAILCRETCPKEENKTDDHGWPSPGTDECIESFWLWSNETAWKKLNLTKPVDGD